MLQIDYIPIQKSPMVNECNRKRLADYLSKDSPLAKRSKSTRRHEVAWFPPSYWDKLSKVFLTPLALRELNRRNGVQHNPPTPADPTSVISKDLSRFARHGGPNLGHLRGFSTSTRDRQTQPTMETSVGSKTRKSSAYDSNFQEHLIDHGIYPMDHDYDDDDLDAEPRNLDSLCDQLLVPVASISLSTYSQSAFRDFRKKTNQAIFENDVMITVVPIICGNCDIPNKQNVLFTELKPIINGSAVKPKPDLFDGARLRDLNQELRSDQKFRSTVIPTKHPSVPVAPNFFFEVKGRNGHPSVAQLQACYEAAHGTRAMHDLKNYKALEPIYDGNADTFSAVYHSTTGSLQLFAHHVTAPSAAGGLPEYHMTQLKAYSLTSDRETFVQGASAFRNVRRLAEEKRRAFIQIANARATQAI